MKKPTDKERLDWLTRHRSSLYASLDAHLNHRGWWTIATGAIYVKSPRAAIDAAINAERKTKER